MKLSSILSLCLGISAATFVCTAVIMQKQKQVLQARCAAAQQELDELKEDNARKAVSREAARVAREKSWDEMRTEIERVKAEVAVDKAEREALLKEATGVMAQALTEVDKQREAREKTESAQALAAAMPESFTTRIGDTYHEVKFGKATAFDVCIVHKEGVARVLLKDLPEALQVRFDYDEVSAKEALEAHIAEAVQSQKDDEQWEAEMSKVKTATAEDRKYKTTPVFNARKYGDLFVESGSKPGIRSLSLNGRTYTKVQIIARESDGMVRLQTQQGEKSAALHQLPQDWVAALAEKEAAQGTAKTAAERKILNIDREIKARAAEEWPTSYSMQQFVYNQEKSAWEDMRSYAAEPSLAEIVATARRDWPSNYHMQVYVVKKEAAARASLRR